MTLEQIKEALKNGKRVFWCNHNYEVIADPLGGGRVQYLIHSKCNDNYIGLTWTDGVTMNCNSEDEFFIS